MYKFNCSKSLRNELDYRHNEYFYDNNDHLSDITIANDIMEYIESHKYNDRTSEMNNWLYEIKCWFIELGIFRELSNNESKYMITTNDKKYDFKLNNKYYIFNSWDI